MASFVLSFFPLDVLDGIWDLIESVSEGFLTYSFKFSNVISSTIISRICVSLSSGSNKAPQYFAYTLVNQSVLPIPIFFVCKVQ